MPRPRKCRTVCHLPATAAFVPAEGEESLPPIVLTVDEFETLRLIDREGLSQEDCSWQMGVARTTVQQIYACARKKLADMLVEGRPLAIGGGDFRFSGWQVLPTAKGEQQMRIAVTYENGMVFQHFGHTSQFKVYDVENGEIKNAQVVDTNGSGHGALAGLLQVIGADVLICGGIGGGARMVLDAAGIRLYGGVSGEADKAVEALLQGGLNFDPNVRCSHHDHEDGQDHVCGEHGCGQHEDGHTCGHCH